MLKNYILVALRNLGREKLYAAINVIGLAVALTVCLLVLAYVKHELSFDRFHADSDRLYRVNYLIPESGNRIRRSAGTAFVLAPILRERMPEIEAVIALADIPEAIVRHGDVSFREPLQFADSQFFSVFSFPLIEGRPSTALLNPNSVVLSQRLAHKYFGDEPALGRIISIEVRGKVDNYEITGVCDNVPGNSSIAFNMVMPLRKLFSIYEGAFTFEWNLTWPSTYVRLQPGVSVGAVNAKLASLAVSLPIDPSGAVKTSLALQPFTDVHFDYNIDNAPNNASKPMYSYILSGIAVLVLALACINFMTLAIGRSQTRAREVGIRKVMGAGMRHVLARFLGEAGVLCTLAVALAVVLAELLLPAFNELAGKQIDAGIWLDVQTLAGAVILVVLTSLLAGGYPAIVLARTRLRDSVKGKASLLSGTRVTRVLISLQFGLSIALIIAAFVMSSQLRFLQSVPIGFDKEHLLLVKLGGRGEEKLRYVELLRNRLAEHSQVLSVSAAGRSFDGSGMANVTTLPDSSEFLVYANPADQYFVETMGLSLIEGSNFTGNTLPDSLEPLLVNATLVKRLKWASALGQAVPGLENGQVIGVVNDFHFRSLTEPIEPVVIPFASRGWASDVRFAYFRIRPGDLAETIGAIQDAWEAVTPNLPFDFQFMDDHIDAQYRFEQRWWQIVSYSAILAILVACFGAFGLTALAVARRQKEIGVRKVLGASSGQIINLLNREFFWLVAFGNLLAWPAAYYATHSWLEGFAYHVNLSIWPFVLAALVTLLVVIATASAQAIRAAWANPVKSLRYE